MTAADCYMWCLLAGLSFAPVADDYLYAHCHKICLHCLHWLVADNNYSYTNYLRYSLEEELFVRISALFR